MGMAGAAALLVRTYAPEGTRVHRPDEGVPPAGWWFKPEYIINELNINAVITSPSHDEVRSHHAPCRPGTFAWTMQQALCCGLHTRQDWLACAAWAPAVRSTDEHAR